MSDTSLSPLLTTKELQARLVKELGDGYRFTERYLNALGRREHNPMPCASPAGPNNRGNGWDWDQVLEWFEQETEREDAEDDVQISGAEGIRVTVRAIADELRMDQRTVIDRLRNWNIAPVGKRKNRTGPPADLYRLSDIFDAFTASTQADDPDMLPATERDAFYRSELRKDELRRQRGELIEIDDARRIFNRLIEVRRDFYELLPDALERKLNLDAAALDEIQRQIDKTRQAEAQRILDLHAELSQHQTAITAQE
ncbi:MAG: DUF1441 family protein [Lamprobacter sp.]|uniref:DUF1441 family protein n=1 Tax=Lamprobacter sp. TaxID=3100796 RepID=UPI002B25FFCC|nr:DUF1441 family protein [Lamprobacter sp.]MEA3641279.1 DUF1441 family protein [Lamprobacter sp.]